VEPGRFELVVRTDHGDRPEAIVAHAVGGTSFEIEDESGHIVRLKVLPATPPVASRS